MLRNAEMVEAADRRYVTALELAPQDVRAAVMRSRVHVDSSVIAGAVSKDAADLFKQRLQSAISIVPKDGEERANAFALIDALGHEILVC